METYKELLKQMENARPGKECRVLHRKLRKYGTGMPLAERYPHLAIWISVIAFIISIAAFAVKVIGTGS